MTARVASPVRWDADRRARAALTAVCEAGAPRLAQQVREHGAEQVFATLREAGQESRWARRAKDLDVDALLAQAQRHRVGFVQPGDEQWPHQLDVLDEVAVSGLGGMPVGLWVRGPGSLGEWAERAVALVGARACSPYGDHVATGLAIDLAAGGAGSHGWTVVSGGAYGIDAAAHRGAVAAGGRTLAVLASGLDAPYPRGNSVLFERLAGEQLLVSEVPCGAHPTRVGFLARNRLIAALSRGTVVVEAAARSGASNTASWAAECGRQVMAVPGPVTSSLSVTPHRLVRDGRATLVTDADDVRALLEPLDTAPHLPVGGPRRMLDGLDPALLLVREVLPARGGLAPAEVARRAGTTLGQVLARLAELEGAGLACRDEQGLWRIRKPAASR